MNKKKEKTIRLITSALERLLEKESYGELTVSDIIVESGVSRSTFYAHFKKKEDVLKNVCVSIFNHVFTTSQHDGHHTEDLSEIPFYDYRWMTAHIFFHFKAQGKLVSAIFSSGASHLFYRTLGKEVHRLMKLALPGVKIKHPGVPDEILETAMSGAFVDLLKFYVVNEREETAEEMANYFYSLFE
jgi:AcrR family transcriptional regulator